MPTAEIQAPAPGATALVIIDMINELDFDEAPALKAHAEPAAAVIERLRTAADALGAPVVYVNDNFGQWHSERSKLVEHCLRPDCIGRDLVRRLEPRPDDYFVIKPQVSGFYATNLPVLLPKLGVSRLVLTGIAADICVLFTAADAHMRDYELWIPSDAVASAEPDHAAWALNLMGRNFSAETRSTEDLSLKAWVEAGAKRS
jgi:nicotinamidase-related amidase